MKGKTIFFALLIVGGLLMILVDQLGLPSVNLGSFIAGLWVMWQVKVALASVVGLIIILLVVRGKKSSAPTTPTPGYKKAAPVKLGFAEYLILAPFAILFATFAVWAAWHWVVLGIPKTFGAKSSWVQSIPEVRVVNNGFHRHDAPTPPIITPRPLDRKVKPDVVYDAFRIKAGDKFSLSFSRPIQLQIKGPGSTGFDTFKTPGKFRAKNSGVIQIKSETGGNKVRVAPAT